MQKAQLKQLRPILKVKALPKLKVLCICQHPVTATNLAIQRAKEKYYTYLSPIFMNIISLRKIKPSDKRYFARWWRDKELLKLTSGILKLISDKEVEKYFSVMTNSSTDYHFMILLDKKVIGHIVLAKRKNDWYETQIVIGEKQYWGRGYGTKAIKSLLKKAKKLRVSKIYLEVRPTNTRAIVSYENSGFVKVGIKKYPKNKYLSKILKMEFKL